MSLIVVDRSRIEADWRCQRERYWLTEYKEDGIVPVEPPLPLLLGIIIHHGLEHLTEDAWESVLEGRAVEVQKLVDHYSDDYLLMAEGLIKAFQTRVFPQWLEKYDLVAVEQELDFEYEGVTFMCRPDMLLRDKRDGALWYPDFKSFSRWGNKKWYTALQQQLTIRACEQVTGEKIRGAWIQGLGKGSRGKGGKIYHPLVYAYRRPGEPGLTPTHYAVKYGKGLERFRVDQYEGGIDAWIKSLDDDTIATIFPRSPDIFPSTYMMDEFLKQRVMREVDIQSAKGRDLDNNVYFPQTFSQCESDWGMCPYAEACWTKQTREDPIGSGLYAKRVPHHELERRLSER